MAGDVRSLNTTTHSELITCEDLCVPTNKRLHLSLHFGHATDSSSCKLLHPDNHVTVGWQNTGTAAAIRHKQQHNLQFHKTVCEAKQ